MHVVYKQRGGAPLSPQEADKKWGLWVKTAQFYARRGALCATATATAHSLAVGGALPCPSLLIAVTTVTATAVAAATAIAAV